MTNKTTEQIKYIASCSFGKDSIATVILAHLYDEPLDLIVYSEVMFDEETSGEHPLHRDFIYNKAIPTFENWGYKVKVLRNEKMNYTKSYLSVVTKSKTLERNGKLRGFLIPFCCKMNSDCKVKPIKDFYKKITKTEKIVQYIGIASDEPVRLERLKNTNKVSLLQKYNYTERMARDLCQQYDLLSPIYSYAKRGGCWFCPNAGDKELIYVKENHSELWEKLKELPKNNLVSNKFNRVESFEELDERLEFMIQNEKAQMKLF